MLSLYKRPSSLWFQPFFNQQIYPLSYSLREYSIHRVLSCQVTEMIEEIFECLGYHERARRVRLWWIDAEFDRHRHEDEDKWIEKYRIKEELEVVILQRIRRIERDQKELVATEGSASTLLRRSPRENPSAASEYNEALEKQLEELQRLYLVNREELCNMELRQPRDGQGSRFREWRTIRRLKVYHDKPMLWMDSRERCARNDGCCGRDCGCCEKPLRTYFEPVMDSYEMREVVGIYGHCSSECGCCIRNQRYYKPHAGIEDMIRNLSSNNGVGEEAGNEMEEIHSDQTFLEEEDSL